MIFACTGATVIEPGPGGEGGQGSSRGGAGGGRGGSGGGGITLTVPKDDSGPQGSGKCGNGALDGQEQCDDGNTESNDGCNRICQLENNYVCKTPGQPCENLAKCGNGVLTSNETCDDGNTTSGDGCSNDCMTVEKGYQCRVPGKPCTPKCGDGIKSGVEGCDDGNTTSGDGCSSLCKLEVGFQCAVPGQKCTGTTCGDSKVEGAEGCDDGNALPFDGCSQECQSEPNCSGASCTSKCGDGIVLNEECDDANAASGDGCSKDCKKESGWTCKQPELGDKMLVPVVYRDFKYGAPADFQPKVLGSLKASPGMVNDTLDTDGKPVFTGLIGNAISVTSKETFAQWYRNTAGINSATASKMALWKNKTGGYVNRYGANGEQWLMTEQAYYCGAVGRELIDPATGKGIPCTSSDEVISPTECSTRKAKGLEMLKCFDVGGTYHAYFITSRMDGNPLFFPVDNETFTPAAEFEGAQIPLEYDGTKSWPFDVDAAGKKVMHNFSFTSEVRYWFKYETGKTYQLDFVGDDDVWVFINRKLAVDLGGIHTPVAGSVNLDAATAGKLGLENGKVYEAVVFQAERQVTSSTYQLTLNGFNAASTSCVPTCGDGVSVADEECDNGKDNNDSTYGGCTTKCVWGGYCGDGIVNGTEECDTGKNNGTQYGSGGCTVGCTKSHYCGDKHLDTDRGEQCDMGELNGKKIDADGNATDDGNLGKVHCDDKCQIPPDVVL